MCAAKDGALTLINATPFDWSRIYTHSYQMSNWDLPEQIKSGEIVGVDVDWSLLGHRNDCAGEATYSFKTDEGSEAEFQFQATYKDGPQIHVEYTNTSTFGNPPPDALVDLVYSSDTANPFIFSGEVQASFASTNVPPNWLTQNLPSIGCYSLDRLCLPASHNAGMSVLGTHTALSDDDNTLCQDADILGQLNAGIRYFDIRPALSSGEFVTGHYTSLSAGDASKLPSEISDLPSFISDPLQDLTNSFQGGNGQSIASIISQINDFLSNPENKHELIILDISHTMDTDTSYVRLSNSQMHDLLTQLLDLKHRFIAPKDSPKDLTTIPLQDFTKSGPAVLTILDNAAAGESMSVPADLQDKGFYTNERFPVLNNYSATDDATDMSKDQLSKLDSFHADKDSKGLFALSWTLTPPLLGDIRRLSDAAHQVLFQDVWGFVGGKVVREKKDGDAVFPNLIMVDGVGRGGGSAIKQGNLAALCMAVNAWVNEDCRLKG